MKRELFGTERLLAFSDGVFAVVITLLVLDLRLPPGEVRGDAALRAALVAAAPKLLIFVFTFAVVGMGWLGHHRKFNAIRRVDTALLWLNLLYLLMLCLVPFVTGVLSEHKDAPSAFVLYAGAMAAWLAASSAVSAYSLRAPFIDAAAVTAAWRRDAILGPLATAAIFLVSALLAMVGMSGVAHYLLLAIIPVSAFLGRRAGQETGP